MKSIVDDLLRLARISQVDLRREKVDLSAMAGEILRRFRETTPARLAEVRVADGLEAWGDPGLLRVVLENLLSNAWKYSSKQAKAVIEVGERAQPDGTPLLFVRDNGAGFDMKHAAKLFAPFQRLHQQKDFAGTGVGLNTVQRILRRHGGEILAESEPGQGATFFFKLPQRPHVLPVQD